VGITNEPVEVTLPPSFVPDWAALQSATNEYPFMHAAVELLKESGTIIRLAAGVIPNEPHQRDAAIRCGLLVRLGKLVRLMLADTCDIGGGQQLGLSRQMLETATALLSLADDEDGSRHQAFVEDSLVAERELLADINRRQAGQPGDPWPIEERMRRSIAHSAAVAGVQDVSALPSRVRIRWPSVQQLAEGLGPTAYGAYRMGSSQIHANWHDIFRNHLQEVDGGFIPSLDVGSPRPQPLLTGALLTVLATEAYLERRPAEEVSFFEARLDDLKGRLERVDGLHEQFIQRSR
jgi:hypothetical protein